MGGYLTQEQYEAHTGQPAPENFCALLRQAEIVIGRETGEALRGRLFDTLPPMLQEALCCAAAFEVQFLDACGGLAGAAQASSVTLGKFSYSGAEQAGASDIAPGVLDILRPIGLLYRGCAIRW